MFFSEGVKKGMSDAPTSSSDPNISLFPQHSMIKEINRESLWQIWGFITSPHL